MAQMTATRATRPTVRPTAAPVLKLLLPPFEVSDFDVVPKFWDGGAVGVTVTVRTWPVIVSREVTGVAVHVGELVASEVMEVVAAASVVLVCKSLARRSEICRHSKWII